MTISLKDKKVTGKFVQESKIQQILDTIKPADSELWKSLIYPSIFIYLIIFMEITIFAD